MLLRSPQAAWHEAFAPLARGAALGVPEAVSVQIARQSAAARQAESWLREKTAQLEMARSRLHEELRRACA